MSDHTYNIEVQSDFLEKITRAKPDYEIFLSASELAWAEGFVEKERLAGRHLLGIHVGSGGTKNLALRRWPLPKRR